MRCEVKAKIQWMNGAYGDRFHIPSNVKYSPIIIFDDYLNDTELWSAMVTFEKQDKEGVFIKLTYLSDSAPFERLCIGRTFSLFEGNKKVANGRII